MDAFFCGCLPSGSHLKEIIMDDDVLNISNMDRDEFMDTLRHISDMASCPCVTCQRICDRMEYIAECEAYQLWYEERMEARERYYERNKQRRHHR